MPGYDLAATRVVLVEDHPTMRAGIRNALERCGDIAVVGEAGSAAEALPLVRRLTPEVVLLDIGLPDIDGITLIGHIRRVHERSRVIILTCQTDEASVRMAIEAGANGYLTKYAGPREIADAVHAVRRGQVALSPDVAHHLVRAVREQRREGEPMLTPRERDVWRAMARGLTNSAIAAELVVSEHTVKFHVHNLLRKLSVRTRSEAICVAHRRGVAAQ